MEKTAKLTGARLAALLRGEKPFFHMVSGANVPNFLKTRTVMSSGESVARNLLQQVERQHAVMPESTTLLQDVSRFVPPYRLGVFSRKGETVPISLGKNRAKISLADLAEKSNMSPTEQQILLRHARHKSGQRSIGQLFGGLEGPSKDWPRVSLSSSPLRAYGDVGVMAPESGLQGKLVRRSRGTPSRFNPVTREYEPDPLIEYILHPSIGPKNVSLPRATGPLVYNPMTVDRELAKSLKQQGAVPINSRLFRKLRGYLGTLGDGQYVVNG